MIARLLMACAIAIPLRVHSAPSCDARIASVRKLGSGEGLEPLDPVVARETWLYSTSPSIPPVVASGWRDVDRTDARLDILSPHEVSYTRTGEAAARMQVGESAADAAALGAELAKLPRGAVLVITADRELPVGILARVATAVPRHVRAGLAVRKPGKLIAAAHQKRYPASPPRLEAALASASDEAGSRLMVIAAKSYWSEMFRVARDCRPGSKVFELIIKGEGIDMVFSTLADAAAVCGCDRIDLDATVSVVAFAVDIHRDHALLPLAPSRLPRGAEQTVAEYFGGR
jgi:hypothetical protein